MNKFAMGPEPSSLNQSLWALRRAAGMPTYQVIGDRAGLSHTTVASLIRGLSVWPWPTTRAVIEALGGQPDDYIGDWETARASVTPSMRKMRSATVLRRCRESDREVIEMAARIAASNGAPNLSKALREFNGRLFDQLAEET